MKNYSVDIIGGIALCMAESYRSANDVCNLYIK